MEWQRHQMEKMLSHLFISSKWSSYALFVPLRLSILTQPNATVYQQSLWISTIVSMHCNLMQPKATYITIFTCQGIPTSPDQSVTYWYRKFTVPGTFHFFGGIGTGIRKIWYRKNVSEPVSVKFGIRKSLGTGIGKVWYRKKYRYRYRKYLVPEKSIGIGIV